MSPVVDTVDPETLIFPTFFRLRDAMNHNYRQLDLAMMRDPKGTGEWLMGEYVRVRSWIEAAGYADKAFRSAA
jgi:hypothetical protein